MKRLVLIALTVSAAFFASIYVQMGNAQSTSSRIEIERVATKRFELAAPANYTQQARIEVTPSVGFGGGAIALSGDTAVGWSGAGYYVFVRSGNVWSQQLVLLPSDGLGVFGFGSGAVGIEGDTIVIGGELATINSNAKQGAAYVFVRNGTTWTEQQRLSASDGTANDRFGISVAISNGTIIAGAYNAAIGGTVGRGAAYVFIRNGSSWVEQTKLVSDDVDSRNFGIKVAVNGDSAVVMTVLRSTVSINPAAYVFIRNGGTWSPQQKISVCEPSGNGGTQCNFGNSISIEGDNLAVGNSFLNVGSNNAQGGVYVFVRAGTNWSQQQRLTASDGGPNGLFGGAASIANNTLLVGAPADLGFPGSAYIFERTGSAWAQQQKIQVHATRDAFGQSAAMSGNTLLIAAPADMGSAPNFVSAAYVFTSGVVAPTIRSPFDFDGDGKTDISIFRPSVGEWWLNRSSSNQTIAAQFGTSTDKITAADFTGDGRSDIAFWRPSNGEWFILRSEDSSFFSFPFGSNGDIPAPADFDGDGKADPAVYRPSTGTWFISNSGGSGTSIQTFGIAEDKPVPADYDGDGKADVAIFRPSVSEWWLLRSTAGLIAAQFGQAGDKAVPGDYTGDGKADIAFWRPSTGFWYILRSEDGSFFSFPFGAAGDLPVAGDYDGDGRQDAAVFRPTNSTWFANRSTAGILIAAFGTSGDVPVPGAFVP